MEDLKQEVVKLLKKQLDEKIDVAQQAFRSSHHHVVEDDLKSEGKYDTRAIEAGYLASAQKKRLDELKQDRELLDHINVDQASQSVTVGSLIELLHQDCRQFYFISSTLGGSFFKVQDKTILIISAFSPIGVEVIGLSKGECFEVYLNENSVREYELLSVY